MGESLSFFVVRLEIWRGSPGDFFVAILQAAASGWCQVTALRSGLQSRFDQRFESFGHIFFLR